MRLVATRGCSYHLQYLHWYILKMYRGEIWGCVEFLGVTFVKTWCDFGWPEFSCGNFLRILSRASGPPTNKPLCSKGPFYMGKPSQPHTQPSKFTTGASTPIIGHVLHDQCNEQAKKENKERRHNYNNIRRAHSLFSP